MVSGEGNLEDEGFFYIFFFPLGGISLQMFSKSASLLLNLASSESAW